MEGVKSRIKNISELSSGVHIYLEEKDIHAIVLTVYSDENSVDLIQLTPIKSDDGREISTCSCQKCRKRKKDPKSDGRYAQSTETANTSRQHESTDGSSPEIQGEEPTSEAAGTTEENEDEIFESIQDKMERENLDNDLKQNSKYILIQTSMDLSEKDFKGIIYRYRYSKYSLSQVKHRAECYLHVERTGGDPLVIMKKIVEENEMNVPDIRLSNNTESFQVANSSGVATGSMRSFNFDPATVFNSIIAKFRRRQSGDQQTSS